MSEPITQKNETLVEVKVGRLFDIIKAIYDDNLSKPIIDRFGEEVFLLTKDQADRWHSFVKSDLVTVPPLGQDTPTQGFAAHKPKLVGPKLKGAMGAAGGADTPHCHPHDR